MGVVYKAQDTKLDRLVALKFLPSHLTASEEEKARFLQEAKAASALNHPNVCVIHDLQEHDGAQFIVMEYVDGVTLRNKFEAGGLKVDQALGYAIQIGEALHEAHSKGIVHRDVKSDNIMINTKNQVKVMDFGLAKLKGSLKLTRTSSTVGTLAYMSPEQIQGGEADSRSDIFSFGVVFYEMLTGKLPFRGEHEAAMMYSIVNEEADPIQKYRPELSAEFTHVLSKALDKDPEDRYQSVADMVVDLRRLKKQSTKVLRTSTDVKLAGIRPAPEGAEKSTTAPAKTQSLKKPAILISLAVAAVAVIAVVIGLVLFRGGPSGRTERSAGRKMLAVLPFENLGLPEQEYFADGLTEEITNRLSGLSGLGVIARSSAIQYKKTTKTLEQIGSELGVAYVLQGTIRWGGSAEGGTRVRVSPVLVKVSDGTQIWSQPYDAVFSDVFKIQSDISAQVAGALGVTLLQPERKSLEARPTENSEAYDAYLRGNDYFRRSYREQDFRIAIQMFERAVQLDPTFALGYARLSEAHSAMYWFHYDHTQERVAKAKTAADEAFRLNPTLSDVHQSYGFYYYWCHLDYENALKEFALAQKDRPNDSRLLLAIGSVQRRQGKMELAAGSMAKATELDPRSSEVARNTSATYRLLRNYPEAGRYLNQAIALAPDLAEGYSEKALTYLIWTGDTRKVREVLQEASAVPGVDEDEEIQFVRLLVELFDRNFKEALTMISSTSIKDYGDQFQFIPKAQLLAQVNGLMKRRDLERMYYDSSRIVLERKIQEQPEDARFHSALGIAYAGLGRKEAAVREGKRGVELLPMSQEAWRGAYRVRDLATIYTMVGEHREAINLLRQLLAAPTDVSVALLRIDPTYDPLRSDPDFLRLLRDYSR